MPKQPTTKTVIEQAQRWTRELLGDAPGCSVDDFIRERRREAQRDEEEFAPYLNEGVRPLAPRENT
jgi:hypothetical protein